jgi:hypothetical protein
MSPRLSFSPSEMARRVRILALVTDAFGGVGGISRYNRDLLTALTRAESTEEIIVLPRLGRAPDGELPAHLSCQFNLIRTDIHTG